MTYSPRVLPFVGIYTFLLISISFSLDSTKSVRQYGHDYWDASKGFPYYAIHSIVQSRDGYLWLATDEGAVRFDGVQFTLFDSSNTKGIRHNNVSSFAEDKEGNLWIGTRGGGITKLRDGIFTNYSERDGLPGNRIHAMCADNDGGVWIGIESFGLIKAHNGTFSRYPSRRPRAVGQMYVIQQLQDGTIASGFGGYVSLRPGKTAYDTLTFKTGYVKGILEDNEHRIWVGTDVGLYFLDNDTLLLATLPGAPVLKPITVLFKDRDNNIWLGTEGNGLYRYTNGIFSVLTMKDGLTSDRILSLCEDREGNLWIGTRGGGLNRLKNQNIVTITQADGLTGDYVSSLYECRDGTILVGIKERGLDHIEEGKVIRNYHFDDRPLQNHIRGIYEDTDGMLWISSMRGLWQFNKKIAGRPGAFKLSTVPEFIYGQDFRAMLRDSKGRLWMGAYGRGIWMMEGKEVSFILLEDNLTVKGGYTRTIKEHNDGSIWVATQAGVFRISGKTITHYDAKKGLTSDQVFALYPDDDVVWVGTYGGGLCRIKNGVITSFQKKNGLFDDVVYSILDDGNGNLWMSCNKGIFSVRRQELNDFADGKISSISCISYGVNDGMKSVECNGGSQYSGYRMKDGRLMFATVKGIVIIDPAKVQTNSLPPPIAIEQVIVDGLAQRTSRSLTTNAGVKDFEFQYTALSFNAPEKVRFRYTLEGYDHRWIDAGTRRKAYYTNLPSGNYLFRVIACNNAGIWNYRGTTLEVSIPPQLWETWWFRLSVAGFGIVAALFIIKRRELSIKQRERQKLAIQKQIMDLESRALQAQMNPHFIFNALNSIQECILTNKTEAACEYLSKFAQLLRITMESSEKNYISLDKEIQVLQLYLELESLRFDNEFDYILSVDPELENMTIQIPAMMIQPFVENAIWHGLLHKQGNRKLTISMLPHGNTVLCTVEDNGIGRERASEIQQPLKKNYESKGMRVTRERLEMMKKVSGKNANVRVIDLLDEEQLPIGTKVEILIPIQNV